MKEGVEVLNGPIPLSQEQRNELSTQIWKLRDRIPSPAYKNIIQPMFYN